MTYRYHPPQSSLMSRFVSKDIIEAVASLVQCSDGITFEELANEIAFADEDDIHNVLAGFMDSGFVYRTYAMGGVLYKWGRPNAATAATLAIV